MVVCVGTYQECSSTPYVVCTYHRLDGGRTTSTQRYPRLILQNKPATRVPNYAEDQTKNIFMLQYHFQNMKY